MKSFGRIQKGLQAEARVEKDLQQKGWVKLAARHRDLGVEVDLLMQSPEGDIYLIEVKHLARNWCFENLISQHQIKRLLMAAARLESRTQKTPRLMIAAAGQNTEVFYFTDL